MHIRTSLLTLFLFLGCQPNAQEPVPVAPPEAKPALPAAQTTAPTEAPSTSDSNLHTIQSIYEQKNELQGKTVRVRGKVVKMNTGIMNRNWLHLQDGSGDASQGTHDLTVTTDEVAKVGDEVTITGTLVLDQDFTAGYLYPVMVEKASIGGDGAGAPKEKPAVHEAEKRSPVPSASAQKRAQLPANHPPIQKAQKPAPADTSVHMLRGPVLEVVHAGTRYTYLRLKEGETTVWAAVPHAEFKVGQPVLVRGEFFQKNYASKSLERSFENIWFGTLLKASPDKNTPKAAPKTP